MRGRNQRGLFLEIECRPPPGVERRSRISSPTTAPVAMRRLADHTAEHGAKTYIRQVRDVLLRTALVRPSRAARTPDRPIFTRLGAVRRSRRRARLHVAMTDSALPPNAPRIAGVMARSGAYSTLTGWRSRGRLPGNDEKQVSACRHPYFERPASPRDREVANGSRAVETGTVVVLHRWRKDRRAAVRPESRARRRAAPLIAAKT